MARAVTTAPAGSGLAAWTLAALAIASPWAAGGVLPVVAAGLTLLGLLLAFVVLALQLFRRGGVELPAAPLGAALGLLCLALLQVVPLPEAVLRVVAPGPWVIWFPGDAAGRILGLGPHPISIEPRATLGWIATVVSCLAPALLAGPFLRRYESARWVALAVTVGATLLCAYAAYARLAFGPLLYGRWEVPTIAPLGPFVSKNHFAGYVAMAALVALGSAVGWAHHVSGARAGWLGWTHSRGAGLVVGAYAMAFALTLAVLASRSRGGTLSLFAGLLAFAALRLRARATLGTRHKWVLGAGLVLTAALLAAGTPDAARDRLRTLAEGSREASGAYRLDVWRDTLSLVATSPAVGHGFGAYAQALPRWKSGHGILRVEHAENEYLELAAEGGVLGLALLLWALTVVAIALLRAAACIRDARQRALIDGSMAGLVALLASSLVDFNLRIPSNALLAALLLAIALAGASARRLGLWAGSAAALAVVALLAFSSLGLNQPLGPRVPAEVALASLRGSGSSPRLLRVRHSVDASLRAHPAWAEGWLLRSWIALRLGDDAVAVPLAGHAESLDPTRRALAEHAEAIQEAIRAPGNTADR